MTTCSQCAHYRKRIDGPHYFDCNFHLQTYPSGSDIPCPAFSLAGWSIEWKASGLRWVFEEHEYCGVKWFQWNLYRDNCAWSFWSIKQVLNPRMAAMWATGQGPQNRGTLTDCARALVERVTR